MKLRNLDAVWYGKLEQAMETLQYAFLADQWEPKEAEVFLGQLRDINRISAAIIKNIGENNG